MISELLKVALKELLGPFSSKFQDWLRTVEWRWAFAYILVPLFVGSYITVGLSSSGASLGLEDSLTVLPIKASLDGKGGFLDNRGVALLVEPGNLAIKLPWKRKPSDRTWVSLDPKTVEINQEDLRVEDGALQISTPLWDVTEPFLIVAEADYADELMLRGGERHRLSSFAPVPKRSQSLALSGLMSAIFGFGLTVARHP